MKKIIFNCPLVTLHGYPDDEKRIIDIFEAKGYEIDSQTVRNVWREYSSEFYAGWLFMNSYTDEDIICIFKKYCDI